MAGAAIELDLSEVIAMNRAIAASLKQLGAADQSQLLTDLGVEIEGQTQERFAAQQDPDGKPWQPWSESYAARRAGDGGSLLRRRGDLQSDLSHQVEGEEIETGSRKVYAAPHQWGLPEAGIPQRRYLGFAPRDTDELGTLVADFVREHGGLVA